MPPVTSIASFAGSLFLLAACSPNAGPAADTGAEAAGASPTDLLPELPEPGLCPDGGRLQATLYGALEGEIDWRAGDMSCEGMPRPGGAGARLRFAGTVGEDDRAIAVIIAIPRLLRGEAGTDLPSNVTIIEEGKGRFFSTTDLDYCWVDVDESVDTAGEDSISAISGTLSCIAPLAETNGTTSVTIDHLNFSGFVDWSAG